MRGAKASPRVAKRRRDLAPDGRKLLFGFLSFRQPSFSQPACWQIHERSPRERRIEVQGEVCSSCFRTWTSGLCLDKAQSRDIRLEKCEPSCRNLSILHVYLSLTAKVRFCRFVDHFFFVEFENAHDWAYHLRVLRRLVRIKRESFLLRQTATNSVQSATFHGTETSSRRNPHACGTNRSSHQF
jgi:hypothetical protein